LVVSPDGQVLAVVQGNRGRSLFRIDRDTLAVTSLGPDLEKLTSSAFSPDGKFLYAIGLGRELLRLNPADGKVLKRWLLKDPVRSLTISADGKSAFAGTYQPPGTRIAKLLFVNLDDGSVVEKAAVENP
jgi:hypothetical protein